MHPEFTKADRKHIREMAKLAWERKLRDEIVGIGDAIQKMQSGEISPNEVNDIIHQFHEGPSRELFKLFSDSLPWYAVCRAHYDGVIADDEISHTSKTIRDGLKRFADTYQEINAIE